MHLTQEQLAQCLGISRVMVAHCETGRKNIPTDALIRLSRLEIKLFELERQEKKVSEESLPVNGQLPHIQQITIHGYTHMPL